VEFRVYFEVVSDFIFPFLTHADDMGFACIGLGFRSFDHDFAIIGSIDIHVETIS
jgi:hypothetical protein